MNLSFQPHDKALEETLTQIRDKTLVTRAHAARAIEGVVNQLARGAQNPMLDLIAHSKDGVLHFGDWHIDANESESTILHDHLQAMAPKAIRLLGCVTAATPAGKAAVRHLAAVFKVPVFGTTSPLYAHHFGENGLTKNAANILIAARDLPKVGLPPPLPIHDPSPPSPASVADDAVSDADVESWFRSFEPLSVTNVDEVFARLREETLDEALLDVLCTSPRHRWPVNRFEHDQERYLFRQLVPELATAPGLLAAPELEAVFRVGSSPRFHRATVLLGTRFVRIYPGDFPQGVILRSRQVLQLEGGDPVQLPAPSSSTISPYKP